MKTPGSLRRRRWGRSVALISVSILVLWVALPLARAAQLLENAPSTHPLQPHYVPISNVQFRATDGVVLHGSFVHYSSSAPSVILVAGFKADRSSMVLYARFLYRDHFNVMLYDGRGTGQSAGSFGLGLREVRDVEGAVDYLLSRPDVRNHHFGLLGVSLGSGVAIVAAAHRHAVRAVVADSPYKDQTSLVDRLDTLILGPVHFPLAPVGPLLVDRMLGVPLSSFSPLRASARIPPRGLLLIHSRHDVNPTTPLSDALAIYRSACCHAMLWIAPQGGHAEALAGQKQEYEGRVSAFFRRYL